MVKNIVLSLTLILIGFVTGSLYATSNEQQTSPEFNTTETSLSHTVDIIPEQFKQLELRVDELETRYKEELTRRLALEDKFLELDERLQSITTDFNHTNKAQLAQSNSSLAEESQTILSDNISPDNTRQILEENLINRGFTPEEITHLKQKQDQLQLKRLYLRDQATREGWIDSDRYRDEIRKLNQTSTLRQELGDTRYDLYLYATEQYNRLVVEEVMSGSAAESSGIQPGDHIMRYDNQRIFSWSEIREATLAGQSDEIVTLEVNREGESYQLAIPRGPLGVRLNMTRTEP